VAAWFLDMFATFIQQKITEVLIAPQQALKAEKNKHRFGIEMFLMYV
jgi:hypothetical protein